MLLIHGDNLLASRNYLFQLLRKSKEQKEEVLVLDGETVKLEDLKQALETRSLFGQAKLVIVENLLSRKPATLKEKFINYFSSLKPSSSLILWEEKIIPASLLKKIGTLFTVKLFKIPPLIFQFLDALCPGNQSMMLQKLHQLKSEPPELIFYLLVRRMSQLILGRSLGQSAFVGLAPWQRAKLLAQSQKFKLEQLTSFYQKLLSVEKRVKTGQTLRSLLCHLDFLLAEL